MHKKKHWLLVLNFLLLGCTVGPKYSPPEIDMPSEWHSEPCQNLPAEIPDSFVWWEQFNDSMLNSLIDRAASQNLDLYIAATRVLEARSEKQGKKGESYPHIDFSTNYDHLYYSKDALVKGLLGLASPTKHHVKRNVNFFEVGFDADWEIDLFGMTTHELNALKAKEEASEENLCDVWITLSAEVAKNYIELRGFQHHLRTLGRQIQTQEETVKLSIELLDGGILSEIDLHNSQSELNTLLAEKPLTELAINKSIHRLSILLGYAPGDLYEELIVPNGLPLLPDQKPIGVPSELLRRRPDIRQAERDLAAATEKVGSAIASLFPRLSLRGFIGSISTQLGSLFCPASATWLAGPQIIWPVFNSRLIIQDVNYNKILTQKAIYEYQKKVLEALEETENAIASYHFELKHNHQLAQVKKSNQKALELTSELYQLGIKDNLEVMLAIRKQIEGEKAYVQSQMTLLLHYIALYKALGGSWLKS